jgi:hypothetical protein
LPNEITKWAGFESIAWQTLILPPFYGILLQLSIKIGIYILIFWESGKTRFSKNIKTLLILNSYGFCAVVAQKLL